MAETAVRPRPAFSTYFTRHDTGGDDELLAAERARSAKRNRLPSLSGRHDYHSFQAMKEDPTVATQFKRPPSAMPHRQDHPLVDTISGVTAIGADYGAPPIDLPTNKARPLSARATEDYDFSSSVEQRGGAYGGEDTLTPLNLTEQSDAGADGRRLPSAAMRRRARSAGSLRLEEMARLPDGRDRRQRPPSSARNRAMSARLTSSKAQERIKRWEESDDDDDDFADDSSQVPPLPLDRSLTLPPSIQSRSTPSSARPYSSTGRSQRRIEELSEKYVWTSSTKKAMGDIKWEKKLPKVQDEVPDTVIERFADPVSQRYQLHRYEEKPEKWQVVDLAWDRAQTRDPHLSTHATNFISAANRSHQVPGYTGCVGKAGGDVDVPTEKFQPLSTVRTEIPWKTDTARCGDIPGYTGCKYWTSNFPAHRHNNPPWHTTTARVHRVIPNEEDSSPFNRTGVLSRLVTTVPPHNPFLKERNDVESKRLLAHDTTKSASFKHQPNWVTTGPAAEAKPGSLNWMNASSRAAEPHMVEYSADMNDFLSRVALDAKTAASKSTRLD